MKVSFDSLILDTIAFEIRYKEGYQYWDNCGKIWGGISEKYPDSVQMKVADPQKAVLEFNNSSDFLTAEFGPRKTSYIQADPIFDKDLIGRFIDSTLNIICDQIKITLATRIGNRFQFCLPVSNRAEALKIISDIELFQLSEEKRKLFSEDGFSGSHYTARFENEVSGYQISVDSGHKQLSLRYPKSFNEKEKCYSKKQDFVIFDFDCFVTAPTDISKIIAIDFINKQYSMIEKLFQILR